MYSFIVEIVVIVTDWRSSGIFDESFLMGSVVLKTSSEEFGLGGLVISE